MNFSIICSFRNVNLPICIQFFRLDKIFWAILNFINRLNVRNLYLLNEGLKNNFKNFKIFFHQKKRLFVLFFLIKMDKFMCKKIIY